MREPMAFQMGAEWASAPEEAPHRAGMWMIIGTDYRSRLGIESDCHR